MRICQLKLRYKYRLYPNAEQETKLKQFGGSCRYLWNVFLTKQKERHEKEGKFIFFSEMCRDLKTIKDQCEETAWLKDVHSQVLQQKLKDLDGALTGSFKHGRGFPKYKRKHNLSDSFRYTQGIKFKDGKVFLPKVGWVKQKLHRDLPSTPSSATVVMKGGKWYISYVVEKTKEQPRAIVDAVGIDLGIKDFLMTSDGEAVPNPKLLDVQLALLARKQRQLSKKQKGSSNRKKAQLQVNRLHEKIKNQRHDFTHQLSAEITNRYDLICLESLNVAGMLKNRKLAKAIGQLGWSMFVSQLIYKSEMKGGHTVQIDRFAPSTKTCSSCGEKHDMPLSKRVMSCSCGLEIDRDLNAAINILNWGIDVHNTAGTAEINACGDATDGDNDVVLSSHVSMKQEATCL